MLPIANRVVHSFRALHFSAPRNREFSPLAAPPGLGKRKNCSHLFQTTSRAQCDTQADLSASGNGSRLVSQPALLVSEIFSSIQGEGPFCGCPSIFLRLGLCNLECIWCDTKYTWLFHASRLERMRSRLEADVRSVRLASANESSGSQASRMPEMLTIYNRNEELHKLSIDEVLKRIELANTEVRAEAVVITGGEPLLHAKPLSNLVPALVEELHLRVEFETNGTIMPLGLTRWSRKDTPRVYFNVSPKLANSVQPAKQRLRWDTLHYFANELSNASIFKFVVDTEEDLEQVEQIVDQLKISRQRVWLMPQATRSEALSIAAREKVIPWCLRHGFRYSHRIHVSIWNDQRGV